MSTSTSPLEMDYTNRDYDSIMNFLVSTARGFMPEWATVGEPGDFGTLLLELFSYVGDALNYYIDRVAAEPFLATAVRRQSILGIADMLGYVPVAQTAAAGTALFTIDNDALYTVDPPLTIPSGTVIQTQADTTNAAVYFETVGVVVLGGAGNLWPRSNDIGIVEGRTVPLEYVAVSNGAPLQEYVLMNQGVIQRGSRLFVQETDQASIEWTYVDHLTDSNPDASVYTTYIDDQQFTHVIFGDNVSGRIPPNGAQISVTYRYGVGSAGNVATGMVNLITKPIAGVSVVNEVPTNGGADNESIDSMRHGIPRAAKTKDRAITLQDFADLAHQVPGVAKAVASGTYYTQVKLYIAPVGGGYPSTTLENQVDAYVTERALVGTQVEMHPTYLNPPTIDQSDPIYTDVIVDITVHVLPTYGQTTVVNAVTQAVQGVFAFDSVDFGVMISQGQVFHAAYNVPGVDYVVLNKMYPLDDNGQHVGTALVQDIQAGPTRIPQCVGTDLTISAVGGLS